MGSPWFPHGLPIAGTRRPRSLLLLDELQQAAGLRHLDNRPVCA